MSAIAYSKGILTRASGLTNFVFQKVAHSFEAAERQFDDEDGNLKSHEFYNHVLVVKITAKFPAAADLPVKGNVLTLTGIKVTGITGATPTFASTGLVTDTLLCKVTDIGHDQDNKENHDVELTVKRWLNNGIPDAAAGPTPTP